MRVGCVSQKTVASRGGYRGHDTWTYHHLCSCVLCSSLRFLSRSLSVSLSLALSSSFSPLFLLPLTVSISFSVSLAIIYAAVYCVLVYAFSLSLSLTLSLSLSLSHLHLPLSFCCLLQYPSPVSLSLCRPEPPPFSLPPLVVSQKVSSPTPTSIAPPVGAAVEARPEDVSGAQRNDGSIRRETQLDSEETGGVGGRGGGGGGWRDGGAETRKSRVLPELRQEQPAGGSWSWVVGGVGGCTAQRVRQKQEQRSTRPW